jgi:thymidylate synthase
MNNIEHDYLKLLKDILDNGVEKQDRTGTGTVSVFGRQIRHNMKLGFPLLTTKKMAWKAMVVELMWFLRGDTNIKYLVDNGCNIWNGDAYKKYKQYASNLEEPDMNVHVEDLKESKIRVMTEAEFVDAIKTWPEFAKEWGELGPIYGAQWRNWEGLNSNTDQIQTLINDLKNNPDSRRLMVNAWNVGEIDNMTLPPCHYGFQVWTRELSKGERMDYWFKNNKPNRDVCDSVDESSEEEQRKYFDGANVPTRAISLMWNQRSVDTFLGLPFNIASYALLLEMIADEVNMIPEELIGNLGDTHLYLNHIEQAREQLNREPMKLPTVHVRDGIYCSSLNDVILENYESHPAIKAPLSN